MINEKIDQALYFLKEIEKQYETPSPDIKYVFSAFLSSIQSVPDYLLSEANRKFGLGLIDSKTWYPSDFCKKSKEIDNEKALKFYRFWNQYRKKLRKSQFGKLFYMLRNMDIHKTSQKPLFIFVVSINNNSNYSQTVLVEEVRRAEIKNNYLQREIDNTKKEVLEDANKDRERKYTENDLILQISFKTPLGKNFELKEVCLEILHEMKKFDTESQKLLNS